MVKLVEKGVTFWTTLYITVGWRQEEHPACNKP